MAVDLESLIAAIRAAVPIARSLAAITTTKWDDRGVALLEAALANEALLNFLRAILGKPEVVDQAGPARTVAIQAACEECKTPAVEQAAAAAGIPWAMFLEYAPQIVTLVLTILGRRR